MAKAKPSKLGQAMREQLDRERQPKKRPKNWFDKLPPAVQKELLGEVNAFLAGEYGHLSIIGFYRAAKSAFGDSISGITQFKAWLAAHQEPGNG
jgi:hypothetical protein